MIGMNALYGMNEVCKIKKHKKHSIPMFVAPMSSKIVVIQDDLYNRSSDHADITVVGEKEQRQFSEQVESSMDSGRVGAVNWRCNNKNIRVKNASFAKVFEPEYGIQEDSAIIRVYGLQYSVRNPYSYIENKKIDSTLLCIEEPQLMLQDQQQDGAFIYQKKGKSVGSNSELEKLYFSGDAAIEEALKDLSICYKTILKKACSFCSEGHAPRSIAFPQLSISLGINAYKAAQVALTTIVDFVKNGSNKDEYKLIELFVHNRENFKLYKNILIGMHEQSHQQDGQLNQEL